MGAVMRRLLLAAALVCACRVASAQVVIAPTVSVPPIPVGSGGTGLSTYAVGDLLYASTTTALARLADVATGSVLCSGGVTTAPAWCSTVTVTALKVGTGTLPGTGDIRFPRSSTNMCWENNAGNNYYCLGPDGSNIIDSTGGGTYPGGFNLQLQNGGIKFTNSTFVIYSGSVTPATTGTRYLCISTTGVVTSSASACSGT